MRKLKSVAGIDGVRFCGERELRPVASCWEFQTTNTFSRDSAESLLNELPEDCELTFFDPEAGQAESWIRVRRVGARYFAQKLTHGVSGVWVEHSKSGVLASFMESPLVRKPAESLSSFEISTIPQHQSRDHTSTS